MRLVASATNFANVNNNGNANNNSASNVNGVRRDFTYLPQVNATHFSMGRIHLPTVVKVNITLFFVRAQGGKCGFFCALVEFNQVRGMARHNIWWWCGRRYTTCSGTEEGRREKLSQKLRRRRPVHTVAEDDGVWMLRHYESANHM